MVAWVLYLSALWGVMVFDTNPEAMQALTESQREGVVGVTRSFMWVATIPPLATTAAWMLTVTAMLVRGRRRT